MQGFSPADGFIHVKEGVDEMIKYVANEPSVGLFFVQQHARTSMPYLLDIKDKVVEKIHEVTLHTEDIEDSICVVRSMADCGIPIVDEMVKDINKSLLIMSTSQPKRGLIRIPSSDFPEGKRSSDLLAASSYGVSISQRDGGSRRSYLSAVFSSAKQKATGFRWIESHKVPESHNTSTPGDVESDELPMSSHREDGALDEASLSSHGEDGALDEADALSESTKAHYASSMLENYDKFRSERDARLEEWLQESKNDGSCMKAGD